MSKKRKRLGQAEFISLESQERIARAIQPLGCDRCFHESPTLHFHHWSDPDKRLCVKCYNIVAKEHRPPSKR
jgi:hypothetical protein